MRSRIIAIILVISLVLPIVGCGSDENNSLVGEDKGDSSQVEKKDDPAQDQDEIVLAEGRLNEEQLILASEKIELRLNPVNINEEVQAKISKVPTSPPLDEESGIELEVYDFTIEGISEFPGVIEIAIPMELAEGDTPGAAYLDETTKKWEPVSFSYDNDSASIIIITDHLSKYGVFSVSDEGRRRARIEFLGLYGDKQEEENYLLAVEEFSIGGQPSSQCIEIGSGAAGDALQLGGDFLGNIVQGAGYASYGEDVLSSLGDHLGSLGLLVSVVQIGNNLYQGKINEAVVGSMKTSYSYVLGKVASKLSNSVLSASLASVAIIDYSINKFGTTAIQGREDIYRDAYMIYYKKGEDGYKSSANWFQTLYPMFKEPTMTQDELQAEIDKIVTSHCNEFWSGNKLGVDYYVSQARKNLVWTASEAGLGQALKDEIAAERRAIMYNDILPGVFYQIARRINMENEHQLRAQYRDLTNYLNSLVSFNVKDSKHAYKDHLVRFSTLGQQADIENWTGKLNKEGELKTSFTLYGHMYAGAPNKLDIYLPDAQIDKDEPIRSLEFKVTPPLVEIILGEEISALKYESGESEKIIQLGLHAALKEAGVIKIDKEGNFKVEIPYASADGSKGGTNYTSQVNGFYMEGKIDPGSLTGSGTLNASLRYTSKEIAPLEAMEGETKEYISTYEYDDSIQGQVAISESGKKVVFTINVQGYRNGHSKLQYHSIDPAGVEFWGDNPTITDKSGDISSTGKYTFIVEP